ncbi:class I SAM-dependent methyltransferase [Paraflavitalea soli]|uniref:Class I SAM-dependent methyltransferase n=1 Tax=Paraflavitalea soli TaxID=2315862 RepID=A0A3B7MR29_9BACT|nr:class I SAM-dependent methyltransferase [Paraflavitalea soli]AXY76952.1 class I SAM-dependent methyltransferase [Paraflavitalea soli]
MTEPGHLHETDPTGLQTLERFAAATRFNRWLFDTISPYCKGHVLEVGSGIGNISRLFLENNIRLTTSDLREEYCNYLLQQFGSNRNLAGVTSIDLATPDFTQRYSHLLQQFDTVVALNVIEHIEDDKKAVSNCMQLLKAGGHLIVLVPAFQFLYNSFDKELGHFKRYTGRSLRALEKGAGLEVIHQQYFNVAGMPGWFINGSLLRRRLIPRKQLLFFDKLIPILQVIDRISFHSFGLSTIAVGRKPH